MRAMVPVDRAPRPLSVLDTVPGETPARRATSVMVAAFLLAGFLLGGIAFASLSRRPRRQAARGRSDRLSIGEERAVCEVSFWYRFGSPHLVKTAATPCRW